MTTPKLRFTEARVRELAPGTYADEVEHGLVLYVSSTAKTWGLYKWSPVDRRPIRKSLGRYPLVSVEEARKKAKTLSLKILDGVSLARPERVTLKYVMDRYEARNKARGDRHPGWLTDTVLLGFKDWLERDLSEITRADLADRHDLIATQRGRVAAARAVKAMRSLYKYADELDLYVGRNPAKAVRVKDSQPRKRYYGDDELASFDKALDDPSHAEWVAPYFRLLVETGARRSNVASMRWSNVDLKNAVWRIPAADFKTGTDSEVYLTERAVAILKARKEGSTSEWVFPSAKSAAGHLREPWFAFSQVLKLAGLEGTTIHDLRRTKGVRLVEKGAPITVVAAILGHRNPATTARVYGHATPAAIRGWIKSG
jgi:integrase